MHCLFHLRIGYGRLVDRFVSSSYSTLHPTDCLLHFARVEDHEKCIVVIARLCVCLCVCLSAAACLQYCKDPDVTWGSGIGAAPSCALLGGFAIGARVALLWQHYGNVWQSRAVIRQAQRTPHALRTHARTSDKIDAPAACATLSATRPFHFVHTARALQREREMLASTCL